MVRAGSDHCLCINMHWFVSIVIMGEAFLGPRSMIFARGRLASPSGECSNFLNLEGLKERTRARWFRVEKKFEKRLEIDM